MLIFCFRCHCCVVLLVLTYTPENLSFRALFEEALGGFHIAKLSPLGVNRESGVSCDDIYQLSPLLLPHIFPCTCRGEPGNEAMAYNTLVQTAEHGAVSRLQDVQRRQRVQ